MFLLHCITKCFQMRDADAIAKKLYHVFCPKESKSLLRECKLCKKICQISYKYNTWRWVHLKLAIFIK